MPGSWESLNLADQLQRLEALAQSLVVTLGEQTADTADLIERAARQHNVPTSYMRTALNFAQSARMVDVDDFTGEVRARQLVAR